MLTPRTRQLLTVIAAVLLAGCERKISGPAPSISGVAPQAVCREQLTTTVSLSGAGLAPLVSDGLTGEPLVNLPSITLIRAKSISGESGSGTSLLIPDDPTDPSKSRVKWISNESMTFEFSPELGAEAGLYSIHVENRNGQAADFPESFLVVPRPTVASVIPDILCSDKGNSVTVTGDFFIRIGSTLPTVTFDGKAYSPESMSECRRLPGTAGLEACTQMVVLLPKQTLLPRSHQVVVTNPPPVACGSSDPVLLTLVPEPTLSKIEPDMACTAQGENQLTATGTGFISIDGVTPSLLLGSLKLPTTASNCTQVSGPKEDVKSCTTLSAVLPKDALVPGTYDTVVVNPDPAGCQTSQVVKFTVLPPPSITAVQPDLVCSAESAQTVSIIGSGFLTVDGAVPTVKIGSLTLSPTTSNCTPVSGPTETVSACTTLSVVVPNGTAVTGEQQVTVTNPTPAGCTSASKKILLAPPPTLSSIVPPGVCATATSPVAVELRGQDFLQVGGAARPTVTIGGVPYAASMVSSTCTALADFSQTIDRCTSITITVNPGDLSGGQHQTVVRNPAPAACSSTQSVPFNVVPKPTLTGITPSKVCAGGGALDLTGTNFVTGMQVRLLTSPPAEATSVTINSSTSARVVFTGPLPVGGPFDLEIVTAGGGCDATLSTAVTVTNGPIVFFVDPPVFYNSITIQGTLYASGFDAATVQVKIRPNGTTNTTTVPSQVDPIKANRILFTLASGTAPGDYDVIVSDAVTAGCPGELLTAFKVVNQTTLALTAINPGFGYTNDETAVEVTANPTTGGGLKGLPRVYLSASGGGQARALESVSLIDSGRLTAVVPKGLTVGTYDLIVVNPDGGVGVLTAAFKVLSDPVPFIDSVSPGSLVTGQAAAAFQAVGGNFRTPTLQFRCQNATSGSITTYNGTVSSSTATTIDGTMDTTSVSDGAACIVRATNSDGSFADFSALVFKNPAQKLTTFRSGPSMALARRALVAEAGFVTRTAQFLYAIGGDNGSAATTHDTVEAVPLDLFGNPGTYSTQRNKLSAPRAFATGQRIGRFLYVAGGRQDASTVLGSVERAYLLNPSDRVDITDFDLAIVNQGLSAGVYYYRVAAVMGASDLFNPSGENLPSDAIPLSIPTLASGKTISVTLKWATVTGAANYNVYRTINPNDPAGSEKLLAQVSAPTTSFTDDGTLTPAGQSPLPVGSTGLWHNAGTLPITREGAASAVAVDPIDSTKRYLYVLGGRNQAGTLQNTYDAIPVTVNSDGSQTIGIIATGATTLGAARWQLAAYGANAVNAPRVGNAQYIYAAGGLLSTGMATGRTEAAVVGAGGVLGTFSNVNATGLSPARAGFGHAIANNFLFAFGGQNAAPSNTSSAAQISTTPPDVDNWQNTSANMLVDRYLMGSTFHGAFIYIVGGQGTAGPTASTEQIIW